METSKRLAAVVVAGATVAATAAIAATVAAQEPTPQPTTIHLVARDSESRFGMVDAPPRRREGPADMFTISARLRDSAGRPAGRAQAVFVQTSASHAQGSATFALKAGRIVVSGILDEPGDADELVVVGGSGAYAGSRGSVTITQAGGASRFRFTLTG